ncbi:MAG: DUF928 domain-containing protein [Cyanobacteria bacterium P01_F01_bin.150]
MPVLCSGLAGASLYDLTLEVSALPAIENSTSARLDSSTLQNIFVPPNDSLPRGSQTRGAASRGSCRPTEDPQASQAEPQGNVSVLPKSNYGRTVSERPVFLVYLSDIPESTHSFFFHIRDEQGENVYGTFLPLEPNTKMLRIQLPEEALRLEIGQFYKWSVAVPCSGDLKPDTPFVSGWIERVEDASLVNTASLPALEAVYRYGQAGIWYDMVAMLDELHRSQPQDLTTMMVWQNTLQQIGIYETLGVLQ